MNRTVALVGTTASGKSDVARAVALADPGVELVSVDSMCVYRHLDVATAKPSVRERAALRWHLVDLVDPSEEFTVAEFQAAARTALAGIAGRGHAALLVGGTGLYHRAVIDDLALPGRYPGVLAALEAAPKTPGADGAPGPGSTPALHARLAALDPPAAARIDPANRRRILRALEVTLGSGRPFSSYGPGLTAYPPSPVRQIGLAFDPEAVDRRIAERFEGFLADGLVEEVRRLAARPGGLSRTARQALGYRELLAHVEDGVPLAACVAEAVRRTRAFARRQASWFRRDPRIEWVAPGEDAVAALEGALSVHDEAPRTARLGR